MHQRSIYRILMVLFVVWMISLTFMAYNKMFGQSYTITRPDSTLIVEQSSIDSTYYANASQQPDCLRKSDLEDIEKFCEKAASLGISTDKKVSSLLIEIGELKSQLNLTYKVSSDNYAVLEKLSAKEGKQTQVALFAQIILIVLGFVYVVIKWIFMKSEAVQRSSYVELIFGYLATAIIPTIHLFS